MAKITPEFIATLTQQFAFASQSENWVEVQALDLQLRPILTAMKGKQLPPQIKKELGALKHIHQKTMNELAIATSQLEQRMAASNLEKERFLAYQLAMDME